MKCCTLKKHWVLRGVTHSHLLSTLSLNVQWKQGKGVTANMFLPPFRLLYGRAVLSGCALCQKAWHSLEEEDLGDRRSCL